MRVLSGLARGVPLKTLPDFNTRPILDRVKKSLFDILFSAGLLDRTRVADLYAGTGTMGLEALSRGAAHCLFVERRPDAIKLLEENLAKTRLADRAEVKRDEVRRVLERLPTEPLFDLLLYDPPFEFSREAAHRAALAGELELAAKVLAPEGRLVLRCEKKAEPPQAAGLALARHWTDGPHALCFYGRA
ncbi:MAG: 23S rRNA (adenine(2030)-N(6))-methyltransferase RlmJ [Planctomycetota bacterium]|nr:23S rRNA (adenine(2030)-N(6))-methyltransferase RlmJ [Planctomycetota bacterium]